MLSGRILVWIRIKEVEWSFHSHCTRQSSDLFFATLGGSTSCFLFLLLFHFFFAFFTFPSVALG